MAAHENMGVDPDPQPRVNESKASHADMTAGRYLATRFSTLKPPMLAAPNPWRLVRMLNRHQWAFFGVAFAAWTWDAFDFFTVSLTVTQLAKEFGKTKTDITWGITLVLMFRSVGSVIFGIAADRYGRKWPFVVNNLLFVILELGTGFCQTYRQFLVCRALFGVAMGGLYGNAAATALEDVPEAARGLMSGILQQGVSSRSSAAQFVCLTDTYVLTQYAFGYLLATAFARGLVDTTPHGWRPLFWFGACPPVLFIIWRLMLPETQTFLAHKRLREHAAHQHETTASADGSPQRSVTSTFLQEGKVALVVPNLGAMLGGSTVGYCSQIFGRRFSILCCCVMGGAMLYPYTFVSNSRVMAAAFFMQFAVQGAWGVIPIHLMELSPGAFRTFVVGTAYQLGNLASSASSTIESRLGENFPLAPTAKGETRYDYGRVICIFMGCVFAYVIVLTILGPERLRRSFDVEDDDDAREVAGMETIGGAGRDRVLGDEEMGHQEKSAVHRE
ncbi:sugar transporter family protein [Verticillium alfalfae VaMs.102]|uniref:Sugar transporter family protein n=1 Tax=Verticillium alfalfae (strain VaMs.102 / ATCC MYA-4576 / FGSC 10136) TaxID=526221 RepID=C9SU38_VERA1|nr:sugar transporter family protein [Verticillium alfalfae VaMs.102]EEY22349.1 sugar transporter family protein [Verticillium alfalfae VaMs.102]